MSAADLLYSVGFAFHCCILICCIHWAYFLKYNFNLQKLSQGMSEAKGPSLSWRDEEKGFFQVLSV